MIKMIRTLMFLWVPMASVLLMGCDGGSSDRDNGPNPPGIVEPGNTLDTSGVDLVINEVTVIGRVETNTPISLSIDISNVGVSPGPVTLGSAVLTVSTESDFSRNVYKRVIRLESTLDRPLLMGESNVLSNL